MSEINRIQCPHCQAKLNLKSGKAAGQRVTCPKCKSPFVVADSDEEADDPFDLPDEVEDQPPRGSSNAPGRRRPTRSSESKPQPGRGAKSGKSSGGKSNKVLQWVVGIALVVLVTCGGIGWYAVNRIRTAVKETLDDPQFVEKMLGPQRKQIAPEVMRGLPVEAELTMDELSIALKADWKAVESKYGGKIVEVSGTVSNLTPKSSIVGSNVASLKADKSDSVGSLHCQLAESNPFARLTPEMPVTLKGEFTGGGILEDAIIVKTGSDLAVSTTAEDFLKAHAPYLGADLPDEFRDQWFRVTGQIERIDTKELAIFLKGDGQYTIQCHMQLTHSNLAELNLHVGDTIHVLGKLSRFIIHDESSVPLNLCILYVAEPHDNPP